MSDPNRWSGQNGPSNPQLVPERKQHPMNKLVFVALTLFAFNALADEAAAPASGAAENKAAPAAGAPESAAAGKLAGAAKKIAKKNKKAAEKVKAAVEEKANAAH